MSRQQGELATVWGGSSGGKGRQKAQRGLVVQLPQVPQCKVHVVVSSFDIQCQYCLIASPHASWLCSLMSLTAAAWMIRITHAPAIAVA